MSKSEFVADSREFLNNKKNELEEYAEALENVTDSKSMIGNFIDKYIKMMSGLDSMSGASDFSESAISDAVDKVMSGVEFNETPEDKTSSSSLALLGGILTSDRRAVFQFIDLAASDVSKILDERVVVIERIKDATGQLATSLATLGPDWYDDSFTGLLESASSVLDDASFTLNQISHNAQKGVIDDERISRLKSSIDETIGYLNKETSSFVIADINSAIEQLDADLIELVTLETRARSGLEGLRTSRSSFLDSVSKTSKLFSHYSSVIQTVGVSLKSVDNSIEASLKLGLDRQIGLSVSRWIAELIATRELLDSAVVDYDEFIGDDGDADTIKLQTMLDGIDSVDDPITTSLIADVTNFISMAKNKVAEDTSATSITDLSNTISVKVDNDVTNTNSVNIYIEAFEPTVVQEATLFLSMINDLSQDRLIDLLLGSKWANIINMNIDELSYIGNLRNTINGMLDDIADGNTKDLLMKVYYDMFGMHNMDIIAAITYDGLKEKALGEIIKVKIPEIDALLGEVDKLEENL